MLQALVRKARRVVGDWARFFAPKAVPGPPPRTPPPRPRPYEPLERIRLTDEVGRTLFEEYADHRQSSRGEEETGWVLLGLREVNEAIVLATLPAGAERNAGVAHVHFNSDGQALGSR